MAQSIRSLWQIRSGPTGHHGGMKTSWVSITGVSLTLLVAACSSTSSGGGPGSAGAGTGTAGAGTGNGVALRGTGIETPHTGAGSAGADSASAGAGTGTARRAWSGGFDRKRGRAGGHRRLGEQRRLAAVSAATPGW